MMPSWYIDTYIKLYLFSFSFRFDYASLACLYGDYTHWSKAIKLNVACCIFLSLWIYGLVFFSLYFLDVEHHTVLWLCVAYENVLVFVHKICHFVVQKCSKDMLHSITLYVNRHFTHSLFICLCEKCIRQRGLNVYFKYGEDEWRPSSLRITTKL